MIKFLKKIFKRKPKYTLYELGSMAADKNDFTTAFKFFVSDAKKNHNPQSQFLTGFFLYHGTGVKKIMNMLYNGLRLQQKMVMLMLCFILEKYIKMVKVW